MPLSVPLHIAVRVELLSGPAAGERRHRLSSTVSLPGQIAFAKTLPIEGVGEGRVRFVLPDGTPIEAPASLYCDPERPQDGSEADLRLEGEALASFQRYVGERSCQES